MPVGGATRRAAALLTALPRLHPCRTSACGRTSGSYRSSAGSMVGTWAATWMCWRRASFQSWRGTRIQLLSQNTVRFATITGVWLDKEDKG